MDKFEPKETGLKRTVWLFEREILVNLEKTDLKDHHKVLTFNIFKMEYELKPKFDNGRADAIVMRNTANHWLKMWFIAFQTCASEKIQSRQAELDQLNKVLDERTKEWLEAIKLGTYFQDVAKPLKDEVDFLKAQLGLKRDQIKGFESEIKKTWQALEEKDKRIEAALYVLKGLKAENDLWGCDQVEVQIEILEKALRGEHE